MSVAQCLAINAQLRAMGVTVHESPGWQSRGVSMDTAFVGGIVHHTATPIGKDPSVLWTGRADLRGPLANYCGNGDGSLTLIAAGVAQHAGASGGRSMGPLPVTGSFNRRVLGLEIVYPGVSGMTNEQYYTAAKWARAVANAVGGGNIETVRAHAETSVTGKWDPGFEPGRTYDMAQFRRVAAAMGAAPAPPQENDMYDAGMNTRDWATAWRLWRLVQLNPNIPGNHGVEPLPLVEAVKEMQATLRELKARPPVIAAPPAPAVVDYVALAKALCDEQDRRARDGDPKTGPVS